MKLMPARLADAARVVGKVRPEDYVWHLVAHRAGQEPRKGERLATLALSPADVARTGLADMGRAGIQSTDAAAQLAVGERVLGRALEAERREWVRRLIRAGYDGWGVAIIAERGYRRSVFPSAAVAGLAVPRVAVARGATHE